uniref:C-type lectin domain-containing protein n=1 Tax=Pelusios castaneus TaxID=367368 RepID=A0A8C8SCA4_9SAUR
MKLSLILALALLGAVSASQHRKSWCPHSHGSRHDSEPRLWLPHSFPFSPQRLCYRCYRGRLASIHSYSINARLHRVACSRTNRGEVWLGGKTFYRFRHVRYHWVDKSHWNYSNWAPGNPHIYWIYGKMCVALSNSDGQWKNVNCNTHLPFICKS